MDAKKLNLAKNQLNLIILAEILLFSAKLVACYLRYFTHDPVINSNGYDGSTQTAAVADMETAIDVVKEVKTYLQHRVQKAGSFSFGSYRSCLHLGILQRRSL